MLDLGVALKPESQQFVLALQTAGWDEVELRALARTWAVAEADINSVLGTPPNEADPHHAEIRIAVIAAQANAAINLRHRPSTPAILNATGDQLLEWIGFYEAECDRL